MKKIIPIYILLLAILAVFVLQWRETRNLKVELVGIRSEQLKQPVTTRPLRPGGGIPVQVVSGNISIER